METKKYKWDYPAEWLNDKVSRHASNNEVSELVSIINSLMTGMDSDTIQDAFQSDMDADGYFEPIKQGELKDGEGYEDAR